MLFKLSNLNSNLALTLGYLNPALNNSALVLGVLVVRPLILSPLRLRVIPHFSSGIVERAKRERVENHPTREKATRGGEREK